MMQPIMCSNEVRLPYKGWLAPKDNNLQQSILCQVVGKTGQLLAILCLSGEV